MKATVKTETIETITLTLNRAEAEAILALSGNVAGIGVHRETVDGIYEELSSVLGTAGRETAFFKALDPYKRTQRLL